MRTKLLALKEKIKFLSAQQKVLRPQRKGKYDGIRTISRSDAESAMRRNKYELRHMHIAYSLIKGRPYEIVERKVSDLNQPSWAYIEQLKKEHTDEIVCISAS